MVSERARLREVGEAGDAAFEILGVGESPERATCAMSCNEDSGELGWEASGDEVDGCLEPRFTGGGGGTRWNVSEMVN